MQTKNANGLAIGDLAGLGCTDCGQMDENTTGSGIGVEG